MTDLLSTENRQQWLAARRTGIGSSDAAAICGMSPWQTAWELYLDKKGELPDRDPTPAMLWGLRLEPALADAYCAERKGVELAKLKDIVRHPLHHWMIANPDRVCDDGRLVELKTASSFVASEWGEPGTDQIPEVYLIQVQHQMAVTGADLCDVAALIGGQDFRIYTVPRSEKVIARLIEIEGDFWTKVQASIAPDPDWQHPSTRALVTSLYGVDDGLHIELGSDALELSQRWEEAKEEAKLKDEHKSILKAKLLHLMGEASLAYLPNGDRLTRKTITRKAYAVEETSYVDFRMKKVKSK